MSGPPFERHVFICTNERPAGHPKGSCGQKGAEEVRALFKQAIEQRGLKGSVRANAAGCLDACQFGISVVVYPDAVWYANIQLKDVIEIVEQHLVQGKPVERLRMPKLGGRAVTGGDPSGAAGRGKG